MRKSSAILVILALTLALLATAIYAAIQRGYAVELADELGRAKQQTGVAQQATESARHLLEQERQDSRDVFEGFAQCRSAILKLSQAGGDWAVAAGHLARGDVSSATVAAQSASDFLDQADEPSERCRAAYEAAKLEALI